jgi:hypothetical protein
MLNTEFKTLTIDIQRVSSSMICSGKPIKNSSQMPDLPNAETLPPKQSIIFLQIAKPIPLP